MDLIDQYTQKSSTHLPARSWDTLSDSFGGVVSNGDMRFKAMTQKAKHYMIPAAIFLLFLLWYYFDMRLPEVSTRIMSSRNKPVTINIPVPVVRDPRWLQPTFPDLGWNLVSPAFSSARHPTGWKNGTAGPLDGQVSTSYLKDFARNHSYATYHEIASATLDGRAIPYLYLTSGTIRAKLRIWLQGGAHGNEPAGDTALFELLSQLDLNPTRASDLLNDCDLVILPQYNPDGIARFQRDLSNDVDPNRDHILVAHGQTRLIKATFNTFAPHVVVDMHEYTPRRLFNGRYANAVDALFAGAKNLNIDAKIRDITESVVVARIRQELSNANFTYEDYTVTGPPLTGSKHRMRWKEAGSAGSIMRNSAGLTQAVSILTETRGIGLADQHFRRRVATGLCMVNAILDSVVENVSLIRNTIDSVVSNIIDEGNIDDIVVTDRPRMGTKSLLLSDFSRKVVRRVSVDFTFTTPTIANITRSRPNAYLIPAHLADVVFRLRALGLQVETLSTQWQGTVEALGITNVSVTSFWHHVTTKAYARHVVAPPGWFRVRTSQKNAALAFVALEPESVDSFVTFGLIPVAKGVEYDILRVLAISES